MEYPRQVRAAVAGVVIALVAFFAPVAASASELTEGFEAFTAGTPNGQFGWQISNSGFDVEVVENHPAAPDAFGSKSLRLSNAVTSGSFGDQLFSASIADEAGESSALNNAMSGGTRRNNFTAEWAITSATPLAAQPGLAVTVSPDRGDGARMSFIRMRDDADGLAIDFFDVQGTDSPANFVQTVLATGLDRASTHTIKLEMIFRDGFDDDLVLVFVNDVVVHIGKSWENYYGFDPESGGDADGEPSRTVDSLLFRISGTAQPGNAGQGFLVDNVWLRSRDLSSNPYLSSLSLSSGTLSPTFDPNTLDYTSSVGNDVASTTVNATAQDNGTVECNGGNNTVALAVGNNIISCTVVAQDLSDVRTYTITINRAAPAPPPVTTPPVTAPPVTTPPVTTPPVTTPPVTAPPVTVPPVIARPPSDPPKPPPPPATPEVISVITTPTGKGTVEIKPDGSTVSTGDAPKFQPVTDKPLNEPVVGGTLTPSGDGLWAVSSDGGVFTTGNAPFLGSAGNLQLNKPVVGIAPTPTGKGYMLVAKDGGVFNYGDSLYYGSLGGTPLNAPINGASLTPTGKGYYLLGDDGGVFSFGDAKFHGSLGNVKLDSKAVKLTPTSTGGGYWITTQSGQIHAFGDAASA